MEHNERDLEVLRILGARSPRSKWATLGPLSRRKIRKISDQLMTAGRIVGAANVDGEAQILAILGAERVDLTQAALRRIEELGRRFVPRGTSRMTRATVWNGARSSSTLA